MWTIIARKNKRRWIAKAVFTKTLTLRDQCSANGVAWVLLILWGFLVRCGYYCDVKIGIDLQFVGA